MSYLHQFLSKISVRGQLRCVLALILFSVLAGTLAQAPGGCESVGYCEGLDGGGHTWCECGDCQ
jgi:hypothetical protein